MGFDGFISYSHAADGRLAPALQRGLQTLAKPWHRRRALWIFRDQTGLAVTPSLWSSIENALNSSEYFVLMASPEAANSPWVDKEIKHWVATRPADRILPVVTDGEWRWDAERGDFSQDSTAVPAALRGVFADEPLYLDLRWARNEGQLSLRHSRFRDGIARLAAPMHGVSKDDLEGEDIRQHRRARRLWSVAVAALALLTVVASLTGILAVRNADRANESAAEVLRQQQVASEQRSNADRSAQEADHQLENARVQEARAKAAVEETGRQERRAQQQRELADRASADAARQQSNARRQQVIARQQQTAADRAAKRAAEQEALARQQSDLAKRSAEESTRQKEIAAMQGRIAGEAREEAERQKQAAELQEALADKAAAEAQRQQEDARKQQRLAAEAAAEADRQKANAEQQQRIAIGRRLTNEAKAIAPHETRTALMLGVAAAKVQNDDEARRELAGLVASTHYAGSLDDVVRMEYSTKDVLVTQGLGTDLKLWNVANRATPTLLADLGQYSGWAISPDGRTVVAGKLDRPVAVLLDITNPSAPEARGEFPNDPYASNFTFSRDGRTLFVGVAKGAPDGVAAALWDVSDLRRPRPLAKRLDGAERAYAAAFSQDGRTLVTTDWDQATTVWDLRHPTGVQRLGSLDSLRGHHLLRIVFLPNAPFLMTVEGRRITLFNFSAPTKPVIHTELDRIGSVGDIVADAVVSSDGRLLITSTSGTNWTEEDAIEVYHLSDGKSVWPRLIDTVVTPHPIGKLALSPDNRTVTTADWAVSASHWNVESHGAPRRAGGFPDIPLPGGRERPEQGKAAAFLAQGRTLLTVGTNPQAVIWDVTDPSAPVRRATPTVSDGTIRQAAVTPDGRVLATADADGHVRVSDMTDPANPVTVVAFEERHAWRYHNTLVISPDGRWLGMAGEDRHGTTVVLWDITRGRAPTRFGPLPDSRMPLAFSPDGRMMAAKSGDGSHASLWTLDGPAGPTRLATFGAHDTSSVHALAFSPDGQTVALGKGEQGTLWNIATPGSPRQSGRFTTREPIQLMAYSGDGRTIATNGSLWAVGGLAGPVKVGSMVSDARAATFSPDGEALAVTYSNGTVVLWDLTASASMRTEPGAPACAITGRGLTEQEWARYIPELRYQPTCSG